jgi:hypothetical protein
MRRRMILAALAAISVELLLIAPACGTLTTQELYPRPSGPLPNVQFYYAGYAADRLRLAPLLADSDVVVAGTVTIDPTSRWNSDDGRQWKPKVKTDGPQFYTSWEILVEESFKGPFRPGDAAVFHFVGGDVEWNGKWAHYTGNDFPGGLTPGDRVLVFGTAKTGMTGVIEPPGYWIHGGAYSVFYDFGDGTFQRMAFGGDIVERTTTLEQMRDLVEHREEGQ